MASWDGEERRKDTSYHDLLIRIDQNLINLNKNFEDHKIRFEEHKKQYNMKFDGIATLFEANNIRMGKIENKINWFSGIGATVMFVISLFKK